MALWLCIMRQIEMKMRRVSRNSFWQQHQAEREREGGAECWGEGVCGCWCIKGDGGEDTC